MILTVRTCLWLRRLQARLRLAGRINDSELHQVLQILPDEGLIKVGHVLPGRGRFQALAHASCVKPANCTEAVCGILAHSAGMYSYA